LSGRPDVLSSATDAEPDPRSRQIRGAHPERELVLDESVSEGIDRITVDDRLNANPCVDEAHHRVLPPGFKYLVADSSAKRPGGRGGTRVARCTTPIATC
jgi:hypothetical protein